MKKTLFYLVFALLLVVSPAFAQHHGGGSSHNNGGSHNSGGHAQSQPHHDNEGRPVQHENPRSEQQFHQNNPRAGYHYAGQPRGVYAQHWDGHRFDHGFYESHWGYGHPFYWGHAGWYGPRWGIGSYFWFNGVYFTVVDPIPVGWYDDSISIVYDDGGDCYYAVNPRYPGIRIHVGVRF